MSLENRGVFQLLEEVIFRRILVFCSSWEGCLLCVSDGLVGLSQEVSAREKGVDHRLFVLSPRFFCCRVCSELSKYCSEQSFDIYVNNDETLI